MAHFPEAIDVTICTAELLIPRSWQGRDQWNHRAPPGEEGKDIGWPLVDQILNRNKLVALLLSTKPFYSVNVCWPIWQEFVGSPLIHATHFNSRFFPHLDRGSVSPLNFFEEHGGGLFFSKLCQVRWRSLIMSNQNLLRSTPDYVVLHSFGRALTSSHGPEVLQLLHVYTHCTCSRWD